MKQIHESAVFGPNPGLTVASSQTGYGVPRSAPARSHSRFARIDVAFLLRKPSAHVRCPWTDSSAFADPISLFPVMAERADTTLTLARTLAQNSE